MRNLRLALSNLPKVNDPNPTHALHPSKYLHMFCALLSLKTRVIHTSVIWNAKVAPNLLGWLQSSTAASFSMSLMLFGGKFLFEPPTVILFYALGKPVSAEYIFLIIMWQKLSDFFKNMDHFFKKSSLICYNIASVSDFAFGPQCMWDISTLTGDWAHSPCIGRQNVLTTGPARMSPKLSDHIRCKEYVLFKGHWSSSFQPPLFERLLYARHCAGVSALLYIYHSYPSEETHALLKQLWTKTPGGFEFLETWSSPPK